MIANMNAVVVFVLAFVSVAFADTDMTLTAPDVLTECALVPISWSASQAPYNLAVVPASDPCSTVTEDLGDHNVTSLHWTVNIARGTQVFLNVLDSGSGEGWSKQFTIQPGNDTSCLSSSSTNASTPSSGAGSGSTLTISPTFNAAGTSPSAGASGAPAAQNAGGNPNSAFTFRSSSSTTILTSLAAVGLVMLSL